MASLKSFLYDIADFWGVSPASLYERQRELVRGELLQAVPGRGPGSGVPLTAENFAVFLIGLLATDGLTDLIEHTRALCAASPLLIDKRGHGRRSTRTFARDLARAIEISATAAFQPGDDLHKNSYMGVQVTRHWRGVILQHRVVAHSKKDAAEGVHGLEYIVSEDARLQSKTITHSASMESEPFWFACSSLQKALAAKGDKK